MVLQFGRHHAGPPPKAPPVRLAGATCSRSRPLMHANSNAWCCDEVEWKVALSSSIWGTSALCAVQCNYRFGAAQPIDSVTFMKLILSRKGFDSAAGKCPSPIIDGRPVTMPIPASSSSATTYADLGLGEVVERISKGRMLAGDLCHHDPMFHGGQCYLGQCGAAQSHLSKQGVSPGDIFLFFGLFADPLSGERHHRLFGYLRIQKMCQVANLPAADRTFLADLRHPHVMDRRVTNDVIYWGEGSSALRASDDLRFTRPNGPLSHWHVPHWLEGKGLTYHGKAWRWAEPGSLRLVSRGQEFVCDIGEDPEARDWIEGKIATMCE